MMDGCEFCALEENGDIPENTKDLFRDKIGVCTIQIGNSGENDFGILAVVRNEEIYYKKLGFKYCPMCGRRMKYV